jgi:hypothetical protein
MHRRPSCRLLNILRSTVDQLQRNTDLGPSDPALKQLKGALLQRIADLEYVSDDSGPAPETFPAAAGAGAASDPHAEPWIATRGSAPLQSATPGASKNPGAEPLLVEPLVAEPRLAEPRLAEPAGSASLVAEAVQEADAANGRTSRPSPDKAA